MAERLSKMVARLRGKAGRQGLFLRTNGEGGFKLYDEITDPDRWVSADEMEALLHRQMPQPTACGKISADVRAAITATSTDGYGRRDVAAVTLPTLRFMERA